MSKVRCQTDEDIKLGIIPECCQAFTKQGKKCSRKATVKIDLRKDRNILGYKVPKIDCCFFCSQHGTIIFGLAMAKLSLLMAESQLSWDEYIALHPEYIENVAKELK